MAETIHAELRRLTETNPPESWHDDEGTVLWWVGDDLMHIGSPLDTDWPGFGEFTFWTRIANPTEPVGNGRAGGDPAPVQWPDTEGEPFVELARDAAEIVRAVIDACALPLGVEESKLAKRVDAAPLEERIVALVRGYVEYARANPTRPLP